MTPSASLLTAVGLPELITDGLEAYRTQAIALAADRRRHGELRARLLAAVSGSSLFDPAAAAGSLEAAYAAMHAPRMQGLPQADIDIPAVAPLPSDVMVSH